MLRHRWIPRLLVTSLVAATVGIAASGPARAASASVDCSANSSSTASVEVGQTLTIAYGNCFSVLLSAGAPPTLTNASGTMTVPPDGATWESPLSGTVDYAPNATGVAVITFKDVSTNVTSVLTVTVEASTAPPPLPRYTVGLNANGGACSQAALSGLSTSWVYLGDVTCTRGSLVLSGWNTKDDGSGSAFSRSQGLQLSGDNILYAQWRLPVPQGLVVEQAPGSLALTAQWAGLGGPGVGTFNALSPSYAYSITNVATGAKVVDNLTIFLPLNAPGLIRSVDPGVYDFTLTALQTPAFLGGSPLDHVLWSSPVTYRTEILAIPTLNPPGKSLFRSARGETLANVSLKWAGTDGQPHRVTMTKAGEPSSVVFEEDVPAGRMTDLITHVPLGDYAVSVTALGRNPAVQTTGPVRLMVGSAPGRPSFTVRPIDDAVTPGAVLTFAKPAGPVAPYTGVEVSQGKHRTDGTCAARDEKSASVSAWDGKPVTVYGLTPGDACIWARVTNGAGTGEWASVFTSVTPAAVSVPSDPVALVVAPFVTDVTTSAFPALGSTTEVLANPRVQMQQGDYQGSVSVGDPTAWRDIHDLSSSKDSYHLTFGASGSELTATWSGLGVSLTRMNAVRFRVVAEGRPKVEGPNSIWLGKPTLVASQGSAWRLALAGTPNEPEIYKANRLSDLVNVEWYSLGYGQAINATGVRMQARAAGAGTWGDIEELVRPTREFVTFSPPTDGAIDVRVRTEFSPHNVSDWVVVRIPAKSG